MTVGSGFETSGTMVTLPSRFIAALGASVSDSARQVMVTRWNDQGEGDPGAKIIKPVRRNYEDLR